MQDTGFKSEAVVIMILFIMALLRIHKFAIITIINRFDRNFGEKCSNSFKHDTLNHDNEIVLMFIMIIIRFDVWLELLILLANSHPQYHACLDHVRYDRHGHINPNSDHQL